MNKNFFITLGILVSLLPFISVPNQFKTPVYILLGALIAVVSYREKYIKRRLMGFSASRRFKKVSNSSLVVNDDIVNVPPLDEITTSKEEE